MIRAYDEMYLDDAMECLGAAVEYAVLLRGMDGQAFLDLFVASGIADGRNLMSSMVLTISAKRFLNIDNTLAEL